MNRTRNAAAVAAPSGRYSHAVEVPPNARWLYISGQIGTAPDGSVPTGIVAQTENCWRNIKAILADAGMDVGDIVKVTIFLTREEDIAAYREARDRIIGEARPASTLVVVSRLVRPEWLVEVEAVAAKA
ncbi:MAG TPA: RidA family protein [Stellaceae bacterium]|nr:RidA family protein [Stellaceae bacterium]